MLIPRSEESLNCESPLCHKLSIDNRKLENVVIANALQLEAARRCAVPICFNFVAGAKFELAQPIRCRLRAFLLLIYVTSRGDLEL